ncbi:MAG: benzoate-CoA ligase family protein [Acidobacteriota bacterium]|nr:benzoate-CoA ligase family protein [Acidobacteriota bacterium]
MSFEPPATFNIADYFLHRRIAEGLGDRVALRLDSGDLTYAEVQTLATAFSRCLQSLGVEPEDRVLVALPDGAEFVGALFGILQIGAVVVMVNPTLEADSLAHLIDSSRASCAVLDPEALPGFERAAHGGENRTRFLLCGEGEGTKHERFDSMEARSPAAGGDELRMFPTHRDAPAIWLFSGGTTGRPKAVVQTHRSFANTTELYAKRALGFDKDDITLSVPKLFFGYATGSNLLFPFSVGGSAVLFPERPTAEVLFDKIHRHQPTVLVNVPTMVNQMLNHPEAGSQNLKSLRFATSAGEALPAPLYQKWKDTFGVELLDGLGTAEMWHIFVSNLPGAVRPGTLGQVIPGFELDVRDDEGRSLPNEEVGRLWVRGESLALGYWNDPEKTAAAFRGGWFVGGDLVSRDSEGYVTYCGRGDDVLKVGGKWLVPQEVESCMMRHPAVSECAVVGVDDEDGLTKPCAFVVRKDSQGVETGIETELANELKQFVLENLQPYKHPRRVIFLGDFPRTHLGKIDRGELRRLAAAQSKS